MIPVICVTYAYCLGLLKLLRMSRTGDNPRSGTIVLSLGEASADAGAFSFTTEVIKIRLLSDGDSSQADFRLPYCMYENNSSKTYPKANSGSLH